MAIQWHGLSARPPRSRHGPYFTQPRRSRVFKVDLNVLFPPSILFVPAGLFNGFSNTTEITRPLSSFSRVRHSTSHLIIFLGRRLLLYTLSSERSRGGAGKVRGNQGGNNQLPRLLPTSILLPPPRCKMQNR